jgi:uncharacterized protein YndB with AHSA1/START domain
MGTLQINTAIQISHKVEEVFEAIVNPQQMSNYFISAGSDVMDSGKTVRWKFPEFEMTFDVKVVKVVPNQLISFEWEGAEGRQTLVEINLSKVQENSTLVKVSEGKMPHDDAGIIWLGQNTGGWANFLACLKAYLEYGINLRRGAFDYMRQAAG